MFNRQCGQASSPTRLEFGPQSGSPCYCAVRFHPSVFLSSRWFHCFFFFLAVVSGSRNLLYEKVPCAGGNGCLINPKKKSVRGVKEI